MLGWLLRRATYAAQGRSSKWASVEKAYLKEHPACELCGGTKNLNVHHKMPFHLRPDLELNPDNLMTLCRKSEKISGLPCHRLIGHLGDWAAYNPTALEDAEALKKKIQERAYQ